MSIPRNSSARISIVSGLVLAGLACFAVGIWIGYKETWPFHKVQENVRILVSLIENGEVVADGRRHPAPEGASREFVTVHDAAASIGEGYYAILAWENTRGSYAVRLYNGTGALIHTWPIDEMSFSDMAEHRENAPQAMEVMRDGSLLVSFDWLGLMARLDACGTALWSREGFFHHAFAPSADGGIWTWYGEETAYGQIQDILKFDPDTGRDITRISFTEDVVARSPETALAFSMFPDFPFDPDDEPLDIFHPNDVEELSAELAPAFPQFETGDLMLSIRELDMVAVIAPSGELKWYQQGPWQRQHDPDFEPDGRITVYNNSRFRPRSSIMTIDPVTRRVSNPLPGLDVQFKSEYRGKHQLLPNGNRLIVIPEQGQAIEVAPNGSIAVEFNNVLTSDPEFNEDLANAEWIPEGYFEKEPGCPGS